MRLLRHLFDFERTETPGERIFYRLFEAMVLYWTLNFAWEWGFYILRIQDVVLPLGIAEHLDISFMFSGPWPLVNAAAMTAFMLLGFARVWRFSYLVALLLFHLQYVSRYCLGEISHGSNVIGMAVLGMALGAVAFADRQAMHRFVVGFNYFFLGLGYTSAAVCKLIASGPLWVDGRHLWLWIGERTVDIYSMTTVLDYNWVQSLALEWYPIATLILTFGLLVEAGGFLMWFKPTRLVSMSLLIMMHFGIAASMKIHFWPNTLVLIFLAFPWTRWIDHLLARLDAAQRDKVDRMSIRFA